MAVDVTKLRRRIRRLGEPPTDSNPALSEPVVHSVEPSGPEILPEEPPHPGQPTASPMTRAAQPDLGRSLPAANPHPLALAGVVGEGRYVDGRSRRRTGRIEQINVKVSGQFNANLRGLADRQNLLIVEVLERALDAYVKIVAAAETSGRTVAQILDDL